MTALIETEWGFTAFGGTDLEKPVREIPKNFRNVTGIAAHKKANGPAMYESSLERDFITLLEFCPEVDRYTVQPLKLEWCDDQGGLHTYTPDTYVQFNRPAKSDKIPWVCEIKYREDLKQNWKELRPKFKAAHRFCRAQGWRFRILTEDRIRTPYLDNARFLLRYRNPIPDAALMEILDKRLEDMRETTPLGLVRAIYRNEWNQAKLIPVLWYMVATFQIGIDLQEPLTMESAIWWKR
jgi:hypothetical protein